MKKKLIILFLLFPILLYAEKRSGLISGVIKDSKEGFAAPGATVKLNK